NSQVSKAVDYSGRVSRAVTGDPVNTKTNEGMTALHVAVRSGNTSLVHYLLDHGARTDIADASGRTPLDVLNGVPALQPAEFADASGVISKEAAAAAAAAAGTPATPAPGGRGGGGRGGAGARGGGNAASTQEIRTLLEAKK